MRNSVKIRLLILSALFSAVIFLVTAYVLHIPIGVNGGYIHIGDAFVYLVGVLLPTPWAMLSAAVGGLLADVLTGAALWAPATVLIKALAALCFTAKSKKILCARNFAAIVLAWAITLLGYAVAEWLLYSNWAAAVASMLANLMQCIASAVVFIPIAWTLDKTDAKHRLMEPKL